MGRSIIHRIPLSVVAESKSKENRRRCDWSWKDEDCIPRWKERKKTTKTPQEANEEGKDYILLQQPAGSLELDYSHGPRMGEIGRAQSGSRIAQIRKCLGSGSRQSLKPRIHICLIIVCICKIQGWTCNIYGLVMGQENHDRFLTGHLGSTCSTRLTDLNGLGLGSTPISTPI